MSSQLGLGLDILVILGAIAGTLFILTDMNVDFYKWDRDRLGTHVFFQCILMIEPSNDWPVNRDVSI